MRRELQRLESKGWVVRLRQTPALLPEAIVRRHPWIPRPVQSFLGGIDLVSRGDEKLWLLTVADFIGESDSAFSWNEREVQSLVAAKDDKAWATEIREFWNAHLPIAFSVDGDYAYYALRQDGVVVLGYATDAEAPEVFATSYLDFLARIG
jgi:hypothetical protein